MRAKVLKYIFAAIVAIATMGCSNDWGGGLGYGPEEVVNDADVRLTISGMAEQTRAIGAAGTAKAGDKMNSLTLLLVRDDNTIERRVDVPSNKTNEVSSFNADKTEATVELKDVERGAHKIYLIANSPVDLSAYTVGKNVATLGLAEAKLATLSGTAVPDYAEAAGMPMTAVVDVMFKQGNNNVSAEVERVVGRFGLNFYNHVVDAGYSVFVAGAELSAFNASSGYLFNHDYTVPSGNTYRKFFASASGSQKVPVSEKAVPFDSYLYETDGAATYNLSFAVGVFQGLAAGVTPTITSMSDSVDTGHNHNSMVAGHSYLLYNANRNRYLYMNGNNLALSQNVPETNYDNYLWTFSSADAGKIQNVGTGRWISRNTPSGDNAPTLSTTNNEGSAETFTRGTSGSSMYLRSSYTRTSYYYGGTRIYYFFLNANNNGTISFAQGDQNAESTNSASALWVLREITTKPQWNVSSSNVTASIYHSAPLTFINDLGSPVPLTQIKRNENLQVGVNIFYNPQTGDFNFDVVPWTSVNGDVTFD
ncbi:MAG: hypothetical protein IIW26_01980 [Tidjanibacter sp.]|nr:hypothetical protein [Tidjanibacter sp.]